MVSEIKTTCAAVVETLSDRDRVSAGSKAVFDPIIEIVCDRDRVSSGRTTMGAAVVENTVCQR